MSNQQGYEVIKVSYIVSLILAIIPITGWLLGIWTRFSRGKILLGVLNIIFGYPVFWIVDLVSMIVNKKIQWLA